MEDLNDKPTLFLCSERMRGMLKQRSKETGRSMSHLIRNALEQYFGKAQSYAPRIKTVEVPFEGDTSVPERLGRPVENKVLINNADTFDGEGYGIPPSIGATVQHPAHDDQDTAHAPRNFLESIQRWPDSPTSSIVPALNKAREFRPVSKDKSVGKKK